jgi:hypothetical protein
MAQLLEGWLGTLLAWLAAAGAAGVLAARAWRGAAPAAPAAPPLELGRKGAREVEMKQRLAQEHARKARDGGARQQEQHFNVPNSVAPGNLATPSWLTTDLGLALPADYDGSAEGRRLTLVLEDAQGGVLRRAQVSLAQLLRRRPSRWRGTA